MFGKIRGFLRDVWALARPYWSSEERWAARGLLAAMIGLSLALVFINVLINEWNREFFNSLQEKNFPEFLRLLLRFTILAALYIVGAVYRVYLRQMLQIRWRRWLTDRYIGHWLHDRTYYRLQLTGHATDNPDQRISEDV